MKNIKIVSTLLLGIVFVSPILGTLISVAGKDAETIQYAGLQWALMGVYNLPFFIIGLTSHMFASSLSLKARERAALVAFSVSITSSIIGTILMLVWALGKL